MNRRKIEHFSSLLIIFAVSFSVFCKINIPHVEVASGQPHFVIGDVLLPPDIPPEHNSPITPGYYETSEYLMGSVAVGVVFLESNGTVDLSTEDWTSNEESQVVNEIQVALNWWSSQNPSAGVSFNLTVNYDVPTSYEPINRPQTDEGLWISEAMTYLGYPGDDYFTQVRDYVNDLRNNTGTNWAFAIFVVDSSNDSDGKFADGQYFAYAYLGGPFLVMTYDNDGWGIDNMDRVAAHEIGHIFYATDEYNGETEYSGYLNASDVEGSGALMDNSAWFLSEGTWEQVGWRDSDGDGIQDILDTFPHTELVLYPSNLTSNSTLNYAGYATEVPYPNSNPYGTGRDVTINIITKVEYSIDSGEWLEASPVDGAYDEAVENFTFTTPPLASETSTIEVRGTNSVGNVEPSNATHTVTIDTTYPVTSLNYSYPSYKTTSTTYVTKNTTFTLIASDDISGVANTYYKINSESWTLYTEPFTLPNLPDGTYTLYFYSVDKLGNEEPAKSSSITMDNTAPDVTFTSPSNEIAVGTSDVYVSWTGFDSGSGIAYYETKIDDNEYSNKTTFTSHTFLNVTEGNHSVYIKAVDNLGNYKELSITFIVDVTPPAVSIKFPKNGSKVKSSITTVAWSGFDELSDIDHYEIRLDENPWVNVATNTTYTFSRLSDGSHRIDIKVIDKAGNYKQARIYFSVNTSLIGAPGWTDDIVIFSLIGIVIVITLVFLLERQMRPQPLL